MTDKILSFEELKADKEGTITPKAVVESVLQYLDASANKVEKIALVTLHEDGTINTAASTMTYMELIGLHEVAKTIAIEEMEE